MEMEFIPHGICPRKIDIRINEGVIEYVRFHGGCSGNLKALSKLVVGYKVQDAIDMLKGITCGPRPTSCPDQLTIALEKALRAESNA